MPFDCDERRQMYEDALGDDFDEGIVGTYPWDQFPEDWSTWAECVRAHVRLAKELSGTKDCLEMAIGRAVISKLMEIGSGEYDDDGRPLTELRAEEVDKAVGGVISGIGRVFKDRGYAEEKEDAEEIPVDGDLRTQQEGP